MNRSEFNFTHLLWDFQLLLYVKAYLFWNPYIQLSLILLLKLNLMRAIKSMINILNVAYRNYKKMDAMRRIDWTSFSLVKSQSTIFALLDKTHWYKSSSRIQVKLLSFHYFPGHHTWPSSWKFSFLKTANLDFTHGTILKEKFFRQYFRGIFLHSIFYSLSLKNPSINCIILFAN